MSVTQESETAPPLMLRFVSSVVQVFWSEPVRCISSSSSAPLVLPFCAVWPAGQVSLIPTRFFDKGVRERGTSRCLRVAFAPLRAFFSSVHAHGPVFDTSLQAGANIDLKEHLFKVCHS